MIKRLVLFSLLMAGCSEDEKSAGIPMSAAESRGNVVAAAALSLYTFDCGNIEVSDFDAFSSSGDYAGQAGRLTNTCYLIRHPAGDLLWDLGLPLGLAGSTPQINGIFTVSLERSLADQLSEIDLRVTDIEFMSVSHSHFDHTGQVSLFPDVNWLVHQDELDFILSTEESKVQNAAFLGLNKTTFSGNYDVFGDGSVVILESPGHTPGHTVLQVNLPESGPMLLTGDLYHRTESRVLQRVPRFNTDESRTRESMAAFEMLAIQLGARVIIQHESADVAALPKLPAFLQ
jgi:N-acyl homoserine lactone hydrolase